MHYTHPFFCIHSHVHTLTIHIHHTHTHTLTKQVQLVSSILFSSFRSQRKTCCSPLSPMPPSSWRYQLVLNLSSFPAPHNYHIQAPQTKYTGHHVPTPGRLAFLCRRNWAALGCGGFKLGRRVLMPCCSLLKIGRTLTFHMGGHTWL